MKGVSLYIYICNVQPEALANFYFGYAYFFSNYSQTNGEHWIIFSLLLLIDIIYDTRKSFVLRTWKQYASSTDFAELVMCGVGQTAPQPLASSQVCLLLWEM